MVVETCKVTPECKSFEHGSPMFKFYVHLHRIFIESGLLNVCCQGQFECRLTVKEISQIFFSCGNTFWPDFLKLYTKKDIPHRPIFENLIETFLNVYQCEKSSVGFKIDHFASQTYLSAECENNEQRSSVLQTVTDMEAYFMQPF